MNIFSYRKNSCIVIYISSCNNRYFEFKRYSFFNELEIVKGKLKHNFKRTMSCFQIKKGSVAVSQDMGLVIVVIMVGKFLRLYFAYLSTNIDITTIFNEEKVSKLLGLDTCCWGINPATGFGFGKIL